MRLEILLREIWSRSFMRLAWVQSTTDNFLKLRSARQDPAWYPWLPNPSLHRPSSLAAWVPLRSPRDLLTEAIALHKCADSFEDKCAAGSHLLVSLRHSRTGKRLALVSMELNDKGWVLGQVAGPCNRKLPSAMYQEAWQALGWVIAQSSG